MKVPGFLGALPFRVQSNNRTVSAFGWKWSANLAESKAFWVDEWRALALGVLVFVGVFFVPFEAIRIQNALLEAAHLTQWYAREHVILCLVPAFFIAGAVAVFVSQASVMKYLGARADKVLAYSVGAVSGTVLTVCSCTVLPLFAGIYKRGAGLGPATAFLYSGPAINVLAIILTAQVLGLELGAARAIGAVLFSVVIGLSMHAIFRADEMHKDDAQMALPDGAGRGLGRTAVYFTFLLGILIFANWGRPETTTGIWHTLYSARWLLTGLSASGLIVVLVAWYGLSGVRAAVAVVPVLIAMALFPNEPLIAFVVGIMGLSLVTSTSRGELADWFSSSWGFARQIVPLLFLGILVAGFLLGRPGQEGLIPSSWVAGAVGGNSLLSNLFASVAGAFMYFATLTEVPILQGLITNGMGKGPALALLLAGPALSLPNMLVIRGVMGTKRTLVYVLLVVIMATTTGLLYGAVFG
jgi:uncharacterized membrane protein YraQ (UPF0718 family)